MGEYDINVSNAKTLDARKKPAKPAGTSDWNPTMIKGEKGSAGAPVENAKEKHTEHDIKGTPEGTPGCGKKKVAKPASTSDWKPTLI